MQVHVAQEHSRADVSGDFIVQVPSLLIGNVPINTLRALLPEYLVDLILKCSSKIVDIRNLRLLRS
nr:hypothetical protein [Burkholderia gladioli]